MPAQAVWLLSPQFYTVLEILALGDLGNGIHVIALL